MNKELSREQTVSGLLTTWMRGQFCAAFPGQDEAFSSVSVVATANPEFGDFQCNDAMSLAKVLRKAPQQIAQTVLTLISLR